MSPRIAAKGSGAPRTKADVARATSSKRTSTPPPFAVTQGALAQEAFTSGQKGAALPLFVVARADYATWLDSAPPAIAGWLAGTDFSPRVGAVSMLPGDAGPVAAVVVVGSRKSAWDYAGLPRALPMGTYEVEPDLEPDEADALCLGWALGAYRYERYKAKKSDARRLVWPRGARKKEVIALAEGIYLARDLVNAPASDLGPAELAHEAARLAEHHGAKIRVTTGDDLLTKNYPMIHAVGRASASTRAPRLIEISAGSPSDPKVALVGKGVCFDTGGLDIKPAQYMKLMKKDMGGAALVLGVLHAVLTLRLPIRVELLVPAVENSVSGDAMRPLDVVTTRKGITVEIGDTDAEGRLVLSDALARASEHKPELVIDAATLTGAARVALGTSLPAVFASSTETWQALERAGEEVDDPVWRLPLFAPYKKKLESQVADLSNIGDSYAGAITAALFLREFVGSGLDWLHMDTMAYNLEARPGRPSGGEAMGLLALVRFLERRFTKS